MKTALKNNVPLLITEKSTSAFMAEIIRWLNVKLAPCISVHGVLVDVYGEGVLITGESGIGKSEAALELIKRGHRLVSDDVVEIRKVSDDTLIGSAPDITRHFIELRGIGIIDVKTLYGVQSVMNTTNINLVIRLEDWDKEKNTTGLVLRRATRNILEIRLYVTTFRFAPDVTLRLSASRQQSTTARKRWATMRHRSCTSACRIRCQSRVRMMRNNEIYEMNTIWRKEK